MSISLAVLTLIGLFPFKGSGAESAQATRPALSLTNRNGRIIALVDMLLSDDATRSTDASEKLVSLGDQTTPFLIDTLKVENFKFHYRVEPVLKRIGSSAVINNLLDAVKKSPNENVRIHALITVSQIKPIRTNVALAINHALQDPSQRVRKVAAAHVIEGPTAAQAIQPLLKVFAEDKSEALEAAHKLAKLRAFPKESVRSLLAIMKNTNDYVAMDAIEVVGKVGALTEDVVPSLIQIFESDREVRVRESAAAALGEIGDPASQAIPDLFKLLKKGPVPLRLACIVALSKFKSEGTVITPVLTELLEDESQDPLVHLWSVKALGRLGKAATPVLLRLQQLRNSSSSDMVRFAKEAIDLINEPEATEKRQGELSEPEKIVALISELSSYSPPNASIEQINAGIERNARAADELLVLGERAVPKLVEALVSSPDLTIPRAAEEVLIQIKSRSTSPALIESLKRMPSISARKYEIFHALGQLADDRSKPFLIEIAEKNTPNNLARHDAIRALSHFQGTDVESVFQNLANDRSVRSAAIEALGMTVFVSPETLSLLCEALQDSDRYVRQKAAVALDRIGDKSVIPALKKAVENETDDTPRNICREPSIILRRHNNKAVSQTGQG